MAQEKAEAEWSRLVKEQEKTRRDEIYGGLTVAERAEYNRKSDRIRELESIIQASAVAEKNARSEKAEQQLQGTGNLKQVRLKVRLTSPTAAESKIRRRVLPSQADNEQKQKERPEHQGGH